MKFVLALLLSMMALTAPAQALCFAEPASEASCCCQAVDDCSTMQGACCGASQQSDALLATAQQYVAPVALLGSSQGSDLSVLKSSPVVVVFRSGSKPLHLASNKLYISKRSFLI